MKIKRLTETELRQKIREMTPLIEKIKFVWVLLFIGGLGVVFLFPTPQYELGTTMVMMGFIFLLFNIYISIMIKFDQLKVEIINKKK